MLGGYGAGTGRVPRTRRVAGMVEILTRRRVWGGWRVRVEGPGAGMGVPNPAPNPAGAIRKIGRAHV